MGVTAKQLEAALRSVGGLGGQGWSLSTLASGANEAMKSSGITTRQGAAVFLSQCMVESAYFRTTSEYGGSKARYAPYYGRGFIQVTFKSNYASFGSWCKNRGLITNANYFVNNPTRLADTKWAWLTAVWYLSTHRHNLIKLANEGNVDAVGRGVHTGDAWASWYPNAPFHRTRIDHTRKAYHALLNAGITAPSGSSAASSPSFTKDDVKRMQRQVGVTDDGLWGPGTDRNAQAIRAFLRGGLTPTDAQRKIYMDVRAKRPAGKRTTAEFRKGIQWALGVTVDSIWGKQTDAAFEAMREQHKMSSVKGDLPAPTTTKPAAKKPKGPNLVVDGKLGPATYKALQKVIGVKQDGVFGPASKRALQKWVGTKQDGIVGPATIKALQRKVKAKPVDGKWGAGTTRSLQTWLNKNG